MIKPPALSESGRVGVVAPASPVRREFLESGVAELSRLGFETRLGPSLYARSRYTAGDVATRTSDLMALWEDPDVDAIFCARGGYGSMELLVHLDVERLRSQPKILMGSSDITALLSFLNARAGMISFHGPMVAQQISRGREAYDAPSLHRILGVREPPGELQAPGARLLRAGEAEGVLLGGCLSLITSLVGTPYVPSFEGALVFLEDTGVKPYQIDRMMTHLRLAGCFDRVTGIIFGEMPGCIQTETQGYGLDAVLTDLTADLGVPVLFGFPSGHCSSGAQTLPFGVRARLDQRGLSLLEGAVS